MKWYLIQYDTNEKKGCPPYLKGNLSHEWEWESFDPNPFQYTIREDYVYESKHSFLDFDFWDSGPLVSESFVDLCQHFGAKFRLVPVRILEAKGQRTKKNYYYFLFAGRHSILDYKLSEINCHTDLKTGEIIYEKHYPDIPFVMSIYKAVIDPQKLEGLHIFMCLELYERIVCSQEFKNKSEEKGLQGMKFIPIDENFHLIDHGDKTHPELESSI